MDNPLTIHMFKRGRDNAITRESLCKLTGLSDRKVRACIADLINQGKVILSDPSSKGYWLPADYKELEEYIDRMETQGKALMARAKSAKKLLKKKDQFGLGLVC